MKSIISKILKFFTLNKMVKNKDVKTLLINIAIYIGIGIALGIYKAIVGRIPLLGNLSYNVAGLYKIYAWVGAILAAIQCFGNDDYSDVEYVTLEDIKNFWNLKNGKIAIIVAAVILCLIPNISRALVVGSNDKKEDKVASSEVKEMEEDKQEEYSNKEGEDIVSYEEEDVEIEEQNSFLENTETFYEYAKGYWTGTEVKCVTDIVNNAYYMCIKQDEQQNIEYEVESLEVSDAEVTAVLIDKNTQKKYDVVILNNTNEKEMKIKEQGTSFGLSFSANHNISSYDELINMEEFSVGYLDKCDWFYMDIKTFDFSCEDVKYAFFDISNETVGEELIIQDINIANFYYVFGEEDGIIKCLYEILSFNDMECCDDSTNIFWFFEDNGTSGESCYYRYNYIASNDVYIKDSIGEWADEPKPSGELPFFAPMGTDYELAQQQESNRLAGTNIILDESNVITEPIESYEGVYVYEHLEIEFTPEEDMCSLTCYSEGETATLSIMGMGSRVVEEEIPDGMVMYTVAGNVRESGIRGNQSATCQILLVLQPDGNIYIENNPSSENITELPEGVYVREE